MSGSNCCFLTCIQVSQETGKVVCYSHLFKNFPQFLVVHVVKGFGELNEHEFKQTPRDSEGQGNLAFCCPWGHKESDMTWRLNINNSSSAYKSDKQRNNIQPWCVPFPILNQSTVPCPVLTVASWPAYRFLRRQVRWSGIPISLRILYRKRRDEKAFLSEQCKEKKEKGGKQ